jgi:hypothetical protein
MFHLYGLLVCSYLFNAIRGSAMNFLIIVIALCITILRYAHSCKTNETLAVAANQISSLLKITKRKKEVEKEKYV